MQDTPFKQRANVPGSSSTASSTAGSEREPGPFTPPAVTLPRGGGAIRGMGEKFAANPVTGTGSMSVPIATSPGRSGFGPQLSLSYDSGAGNGPFGFGWSLSVPSITRKTDKGLPQYRDGVKNQPDSDVYILSGAEDLVPEFKKNDAGDWVMKDGEHVIFDEPRTIDNVTYRVRRYRPRVEGLFARIERWTNQQSGEIHWRSISHDNITTLYGKDNNSRIFDPDEPDPAHPTRIFSWLICQSYDDKGNAIVYEYAEENSEAVVLSQAHEKNRTASSRSVNRYLKRIRYGNRTPNRDANWLATDPAKLPPETWMFEVVFDYGEGHYQELPLDPNVAKTEQHRYVQAAITGASVWPVRQDPFSSYRAGFEVRTYRLCQRVLMFHHFPEELGVADTLVRSTAFTYAESPIASFITGVTQSGYVRQEDGSYLKKSLPPLEFEYSQAELEDEVREIDAESLENLPHGLDGSAYQWVDLDGEGLSGILTEQGDGWYYKRNLSPITVRQEDGRERVVAGFGPLERVAEKPSLGALNGGRQQLLDLAGDGQLDLALLDGPTPGFYERTRDQRWALFRTFESLPNVDWNDPNLRFVDLTGDGHADILITEDDVFTWYLSLAEAGFAPHESVRQALDEEEGPRLVFADGSQSVYLADISGDGLPDLARIRNGEVCYWPNLGYGRFGAKVTMDNAPWFDALDLFDQKRIRLADIDGSGTTDILYLGPDGVHIYWNEAGNRWSDARILSAFPHVDNVASVMAVDLLGNGTACLVWSSPLPGDGRHQMRYIDLMGADAQQKPHLLVKTVNNLGAETHVRYASSTKFYLEDKRDGKPWITRLPFTVHVVERVETVDWISRNRFVTRYKYHHGYFDGEEREFRGFGMVEQFDTEEFAALTQSGAFPAGDNVDAASHVPPVYTKTWFHTGVYVGRDHVSDFFAGLLDAHDRGEYYREPGLTDAQARALLLPDTVLPDSLTVEEEREASRALKGSMLRQEVYADDAGLDASEAEIQRARTPYTVVEQDFTIRPLQRRAGNRHAVFFTHPREAITYHYERDSADPRIQHALTLEVDEFGNVLKEAAIGYGRRETIHVVDDQGQVSEVSNPGLEELDPEDREKQTRNLITYTENRYTNAVDTPDAYRTPLPCETRTYELTGYTPAGPAGRFRPGDFVEPDVADPERLIHRFDSEIQYEEQPAAGRQRRPIEHLRTLYRPDDLGVAQNDPLALLPLG
jgi:hypothetical protein